ncbi:plasmid maintenance protein CcdB [Parahaliea maris]|uniref:Toxin CcdB n=1 Tax=Parahaliea maris TaxID=2716870 RepID=A0A5C8ZMR3_9GAMM|nr:CcdB family protein [Parahaliea maris]TXS89485.1 plasmid maintenance protein CcdB [Parahaliea maris]
MARFDIYLNRGGDGYLLDVQSDLLSGLNTRVVVPLLPRKGAPTPAQRLNPVFLLEGGEVVMATQFLAAVPETELQASIGSLDHAVDEVQAALDMLFLGF